MPNITTNHAITYTNIMKNNYYYRLYFFKSDVKVLILLELA